MKHHIMIVDDNPGVLKLLGIMLERDGYSVLTAENGYKALELLESSIPDLFIIDVMMPDMDGIELCRQVRACSNTAQTPVVILSELGDSDSIDKALRAGADDYITKPILHYDLRTKLRSALSVKTNDF
jgi:DNA-binding response OmpR family regulator